MTNRIELYDALMHLKRVDHKRLPTRVGLGLGLRLGLGLGLGFGSILTKRGEANSIDESLGHVIALEDAIVVEEDSCFKQATRNTTPRGCLRSALEIRRLQRETRLGRCDVRNAKKELIERPVWPPPAVSSHSSGNNSSSSRSAAKFSGSSSGRSSRISSGGGVEEGLLVVSEDGGGSVEALVLFPVVLPAEGGVPVVLDRVVGAARQELRDLRPLVAVLRVQPHHLLLLLSRPLIPLHASIHP